MPTPLLAAMPCSFVEVEHAPAQLACDRCGESRPLVWRAERTALDLDLDRVGLLLVRVGVYRCSPCHHYFRSRPPFLRPDATYTNRVVASAVNSVYRDGMAISRVPERLARDFHIRPSEASVRLWCKQFAPDGAFETDYRAWVKSSFSGVLCVDEVYEGRRLALLLAVDPRGPGGDRLVGFELVDGSVDQADMARFLNRLKAEGFEPDEVITDGSQIYPGLVTKIWSKAVHQLCLFHETKLMIEKARKVLEEARKAIPKAPTTPKQTGALLRRADPERPSEQDRDARIALAKRLAQEGLGMRAISRQLGHSRNTLRTWLDGTVKPKEERDASTMTVGVLSRGAPPPEPPPGWESWDQVRGAKDQLRKTRFQVLARFERLSEKEQAAVRAALALPCSAALRVAHRFTQDWYAIWTDAAGARRGLDEARERYNRLRNDEKAKAIPALARLQHHMTDEKFSGVSPFLSHPNWEGTNNGAERGGRLFRHLQGPHFRMRSKAAISKLIRSHACGKLPSKAEDQPSVGRSSRGRPVRRAVAA